MEVDIDVKFIDEHKDLKLAVVSFGCEAEHEKFQDNEFMEGPWYILQNTVTDFYRVFYGIINFNNKNDYISFIDCSGDTENTMAYIGRMLLPKSLLACPVCQEPTAVENFVDLDDGCREVIFKCIECDYDFIPLGEL